MLQYLPTKSCILFFLQFSTFFQQYVAFFPSLVTFFPALVTFFPQLFIPPMFFTPKRYKHFGAFPDALAWWGEGGGRRWPCPPDPPPRPPAHPKPACGPPTPPHQPPPAPDDALRSCCSWRLLRLPVDDCYTAAGFFASKCCYEACWKSIVTFPTPDTFFPQPLFSHRTSPENCCPGEGECLSQTTAREL